MRRYPSKNLLEIFAAREHIGLCCRLLLSGGVYVYVGARCQGLGLKLGTWMLVLALTPVGFEDEA